MKTVIAYLGPEIPALSATFVYHEILALQQKGFDVLPISVHPPAARATEQEAAALADQTIQLYPMGSASFMVAAAACKLLHPWRYLSASFMLLGDMIRLGFFSRRAAGLVYRFLAGARLARILKSHGCRHLHVHFAHIPTDIAMYGAKLAGISFSFTSHANDLFERGWLLKEKVARSAQAMTISEFNRRFLVSQGADGEKIEIVRCGVDSSRFGATLKMQASKDPPVIGSLGRLVEKKGFDTLLQSAGILKRQGRAFRIELAGDGPLMQELQSLADTEGVADRITFLGPVSNDQVPAWLSGLSLFVLACRVDANGDMDGIPVALMESMAAGVPVISTTVSAIPELIEDGVSGLLVPPGNAALLAERIGQLLDDREVQERCINGGRQKIEHEFSEAANAEKLSQLFTSILTGCHS